jgi:hypothetical protein
MKPDRADAGSLELGRAVDAACDHFEDALGRGERPDLGAWLPDGPARRAALPELACVELEHRLRAGESARVEDYLSRFPELRDDPAALLRLVRVEARLRRTLEPGLESDEYRRRFPGLGDRPDWALLWPASTETTNTGELPPGAETTTDAGAPGGGAALALSFLEPARGPGEIGRLGNYRVLGVLGRGGMGVVLRAEEEALDREVALKVMKPEVAAHPQARQRFLREARAMAAVEHERVVVVHAVGEAGGVPYLAMPLLRGESLASRLVSGPRLSVAEAVRLGREVAEGLAAAHGRGLLHRDVKPANLWLKEADGGWHVLILDFGLARPEGGDGLTEPGVVVGTPAYMAPEQASGGEVDERCDLFSLGCVLYEVLTSVSPFAAGSTMAVLNRLATYDPPPVRQVAPGVPEELSVLVGRLLAKDREGRPETARAVAEALGAMERPEAPATPSRAPEGARPPTDRPDAEIAGRKSLLSRRRLLLGGGAVLAAGAAGVGYWLTRPAVGPAPVPSPPPLKGSVDVRVWQKDDARREGRGLRHVLPLRAGDRIRIEVTLSRPAYLYVVWLEAGGEAKPIYPWESPDEQRHPTWKEWPTREEPLKVLVLPKPPQVHEDLGPGASGMEAILLLAREQPLPRDLDLAALFGGLPKQDEEGLRAAVWLEGGEEVQDEPDRGAIRLGPQRKIDALVDWVKGRMRRELPPLFPYTRAVCYSFDGRG